MDLIAEAALHLADARRARRRGDRIPAPYRPPDIATALAIQARVTELLGEPVGGWKCAAPTPEKTMIAPIYARDIHSGAECPIVPRDGMALIEPEIAYVVGEGGAIIDTRLVLELIGSRYTQPEEATFPEMLADCLNDQGLLVGPQVKSWQAEPPAPPLPIRIPGVLEVDGKHPDGHPLIPFRWMMDFQPARPGQIVTTGSYAGILRVPLDQPLRVIFGDLGEIAVTFRAA